MDLDMSSKGLEAFFEAAREGDLEAVERQVDAGRCIDAKDARGRSAIGEAAGCDNAESVRALAAMGATVDARDDAGRTVAMVAAWFGCRRSLEALIELGADPLARDIEENTGLHLAASDGLIAESEILCAAGGFTEEPNSKGRTVLDLAICSGVAELARKIALRSSMASLERSRDVFARGSLGIEASASKAAKSALAAAQEVADARALKRSLDKEIRDVSQAGSRRPQSL